MTGRENYDLPIFARVPNLELWYHFNCHASRPGLVEWQPPRAYTPRGIYTRKAKRRHKPAQWTSRSSTIYTTYFIYIYRELQLDSLSASRPTDPS